MIIFSHQKAKFSARILAALPAGAELVGFEYKSLCFDVDFIVQIVSSGTTHEFVTSRGEIFHNGEPACSSSYRYKEKEDTFSKLLEIIKNTVI